MDALRDSLVNFFAAGWELIVGIGQLIGPYLPLIIGLGLWVAFWTFAVNWEKLRRSLLAGGWIGLVLIGLVAILVWGNIAPPSDGTHELLGLRVSNYVGKTVYVTGLICIMLLCGAVQLSGCCAAWCRFEEEPVEPEPHGTAH